jgi:hypothetical protein
MKFYCATLLWICPYPLPCVDIFTKVQLPSRPLRLSLGTTFAAAAHIHRPQQDHPLPHHEPSANVKTANPCQVEDTARGTSDWTISASGADNSSRPHSCPRLTRHKHHTRRAYNLRNVRWQSKSRQSTVPGKPMPSLDPFRQWDDEKCVAARRGTSSRNLGRQMRRMSGLKETTAIHLGACVHFQSCTLQC